MLQLKYSNFKNECGTDEAGRGCLAGPVTAAAIILPNNFKNELLTDSKKLSEFNRNKLKLILENNAVCYAVSHVFETEIDEINILNASIKAMHQAIALLHKTPQFIAVDGNKFKPYKNIAYQTIVKGDGKFLNIAAASVLAKTYRDAYMQKLHEEFPVYNWKQNKGYPTKQHREAIKKYGFCKYHRKSFKLLPDQLQLNF